MRRNMSANMTYMRHGRANRTAAGVKQTCPARGAETEYKRITRHTL